MPFNRQCAAVSTILGATSVPVHQPLQSKRAMVTTPIAEAGQVEGSTTSPRCRSRPSSSSGRGSATLASDIQARLPARDDVLGLRALRPVSASLDNSRRGANTALPRHDDEGVALHQIFRHAPAVQSHQTEHELSLRKSLRGGACEPARGFRIIGPHAFTVHKGETEKVLRDLQSLVGGLAIPWDRRRRISRHTPSVGVHEADVELCPRIALFGKRRQPSKRSRIIAPVGRSDGIVELRCRRGPRRPRTRMRTARAALIMRVHCDRKALPPDDTIKTATI